MDVSFPQASDLNNDLAAGRVQLSGPMIHAEMLEGAHALATVTLPFVDRSGKHASMFDCPNLEHPRRLLQEPLLEIVIPCHSVKEKRFGLPLDREWRNS